MIVIDGPHFYCAVVIDHRNVLKTAPIVGYMLGWTIEMVEAYCKKKNWKCLKFTTNT